MESEPVARPEDRGFTGLRSLLRWLYHGKGQVPRRFRYLLLLVDLVFVLFLVASSFFAGHSLVEQVDVGFGVVILLDFAARLAASRRPWRELSHPVGIADLIVIVSLLAPAAGEHLAFLRVVRALRLFRSYRLIQELKEHNAFFRRNEDVLVSSVHLLVFIFVMTALVYELQGRSNPQIANYADALYFTVTALTTTGFGDITLQGTTGRLLSVLIMVFGVGLFLRLAQAVFRPPKVEFACPICALQRHDRDAVHCKACGTVLNIPDEGET